MSGVLGTIPLAAHVILQSLNQLLLPVSMGIGTAANTRVGNLLGAGDAKQASLVLRLSLVVASVVQCFLSGVIYSMRERVAYIYSSDADVINAVARCALIFACFQAINGANQTLRGVMAGCGLQMLNAKVSNGATWLFGLPLAYTLAFVLERGLLGVWEGQALSTLMRQCLLFFFAMRIDWVEMSAKAQARQAAKRSTTEERQRLASVDEEGEEEESNP